MVCDVLLLQGLVLFVCLCVLLVFNVCCVLCSCVVFMNCCGMLPGLFRFVCCVVSMRLCTFVFMCVIYCVVVCVLFCARLRLCVWWSNASLCVVCHVLCDVVWLRV